MTMEIRKYGNVYPITAERLLVDSSEIEAALVRAARMTPEEREENRRRYAAERAIEREARSVPFHPDLVEDRMGWPRGYLAHLAQPYCDCGDTSDGWEYCEHARDLGLTQ